jgi:transcriptional regulator with XRE-family HTH domain
MSLFETLIKKYLTEADEAEAAEKLEVSRRTVNAYKRGDIRAPSAETFIRLLEAMGGNINLALPDSPPADVKQIQALQRENERLRQDLSAIAAIVAPHGYGAPAPVLLLADKDTKPKKQGKVEV